MKIYVDFVLFLNFSFDFLLLLSTALLLKRIININRIIISSFFGSLTVLFLFLNITNFTLFIFKILISIIMILITFGFKNIIYFIKNYLIFYMLGMFLGGVLYAINIQFSYKNYGLIFINNGFSLNIFFLLIISPIIIYLYLKQLRNLKENNLKYYNLIININNKEYNLIGFLDTGNKLKDPYKNRPIILVNKKIIEIKNNNFIFIPYTTIDSNGLLKCVEVNSVFIKDVGIKKNVLLGFIDKKISIDGVDCIIQEKLLEG